MHKSIKKANLFLYTTLLSTLTNYQHAKVDFQQKLK